MTTNVDPSEEYSYILFFGFVYHFKKRLAFFFLYEFTAAVLFCCSSYALLLTAIKRNDRNALPDSIIGFLHIVLCFLLMPAYWVGKEDIYYFFEDFAGGGFNYKNPLTKEVKELTSKIGKYQEFIGKYWSIACLIGGISYGSVKPLFNVFFLAGSSETPNDIVYSLPIPVEYGDPDSWSLYFLIFTAQCSVAFAIGFQGAVIGVLFGICPLFISSECQKLIIHFESLEKRSLTEYLEFNEADSTANIKKDPKFHKFMHDNLVECIKHHQQLKKLWTKYQTYLTLPSMILNGVLALIVAFIATQLAEPTRIGDTLVFIWVLGLELSVLFLTSMGPQEVFNTSDQIADAIFYTNWYDYPLEYQKMVCIVSANSQPFIFKCLGARVDLNYFSNVLYSTYSYINMLLGFKE